jgi:hypothetical protein
MEIGFVMSVSIVPTLYSSVKTRILIAGIKNKNKRGDTLKNISMLA